MAGTGERDDRLAYFSLLKFIGAISIAVMHYHYVWGPLKLKDPFYGIPLLEPISHNGFLFVELFFIISGILFAVAYERRIADGMTIDTFLLRRVVRLYPVIAVTSVYMYVGNLFLHRYDHTMWNAGNPRIMELVYDILFAGKSIFKTGSTNNGAIWYISVLLFCYVVAYILTKVAHRLGAQSVFLLPVVIGIGIKYNGISTLFFNPNTARGLITFFTGVILGKCAIITWGGWKKGLPRLRLAALVIFSLACAVRLSPWYDWCVPDKYAFYGVVIFPSLVLLLYDCKWLNHFCSSKTVKWLGSIAYGIYLWNFPICFTVYFLYVSKFLRTDITSGTFIILLVVAHIVVAGLSYEFIERPVGERLVKLIEDHRQILSSAP